MGHFVLHPYLAGTRRPRIFAHRGFVPRAKSAGGSVTHRTLENTRDAFQAAIDAGATHLETDCQLTSDGEVVLIHDPDLARVVGDPRPISGLTRAELDAVFADRGGLLTLSEALTEFPTSRFNIDVKSGEVAESAGSIAAAAADRVLLTSFSDAHRARALAAAVAGSDGRPATSPGKVGIARVLTALATRNTGALARAFSGIDALQVPEKRGPIRIVTPRLIAAAHDHGVEVHVWTVNDPRRMESLVALGIDGIITDRTDLAVAHLHHDSQ